MGLLQPVNTGVLKRKHDCSCNHKDFFMSPWRSSRSARCVCLLFCCMMGNYRSWSLSRIAAWVVIEIGEGRDEDAVIAPVWEWANAFEEPITLYHFIHGVPNRTNLTHPTAWTKMYYILWSDLNTSGELLFDFISTFEPESAEEWPKAWLTRIIACHGLLRCTVTVVELFQCRITWNAILKRNVCTVSLQHRQRMDGNSFFACVSSRRIIWCEDVSEKYSYSHKLHSSKVRRAENSRNGVDRRHGIYLK